MKKIQIEWNRVHWYSQILAIVLFVGVFVLGFYLGEKYEYRAFVNAISGETHLSDSHSVPFYKRVWSSLR